MYCCFHVDKELPQESLNQGEGQLHQCHTCTCVSIMPHVYYVQVRMIVGVHVVSVPPVFPNLTNST